MKKIIPIISILLSMNLYAFDKLKCEKLFRMAINNFYLENSCKFSGGLSASMRKEFGNQDCTKVFNDDDMKKLNNEVLGLSWRKMNKLGRASFCKKNKTRYDKLTKSYN